MKWYPRNRTITCESCRKTEKATGNNQRFCEDCSKKREIEYFKKLNESKKQYIWKVCTECNKEVREYSMRKRCRSCIEKGTKKMSSPKMCKRCNEVEVEPGKIYCPECKRTTQLENMNKRYHAHKPKRYCRGCGTSIDHIHRARRYCSDECKASKPVPKKKVIKPKKKVEKDELPWEEQTTQMQPRKKNEDIQINPFFLQKRGSKSK